PWCPSTSTCATTASSWRSAWPAARSCGTSARPSPSATRGARPIGSPPAPAAATSTEGAGPLAFLSLSGVGLRVVPVALRRGAQGRQVGAGVGDDPRGELVDGAAQLADALAGAARHHQRPTLGDGAEPPGHQG